MGGPTHGPFDIGSSSGEDTGPETLRPDSQTSRPSTDLETDGRRPVSVSLGDDVSGVGGGGY